MFVLQIFSMTNCIRLGNCHSCRGQAASSLFQAHYFVHGRKQPAPVSSHGSSPFAQTINFAKEALTRLFATRRILACTSYVQDRLCLACRGIRCLGNAPRGSLGLDSIATVASSSLLWRPYTVLSLSAVSGKMSFSARSSGRSGRSMPVL